MEWYYAVGLVIWVMPVGFLVFAMAFVDGGFLKGLPAALLWPLWLPIILLSELFDYWRSK